MCHAGRISRIEIVGIMMPIWNRGNGKEGESLIIRLVGSEVHTDFV